MAVVIFRPFKRVRELAAPNRRGTITAVIGIGPNAVIIVALDGWHPVRFRPVQLALL